MPMFLNILLLLISGAYLVYKSFTSDESFLKFEVAVDDNPQLFKFFNFITGIVFLGLGLFFLLQEIL
jgi:hypothetical protein